MIERLVEYKHKCKILRQIQSNKALQYRRINNIQSIITVFVSAFITFVGFSGIERIHSYTLVIFGNNNISIESIELFYNIMVFLLFIVVIFYMVFHFNAKQNASDNAIALLSELINEIDDIVLNSSYLKVNSNVLEVIRYKYSNITRIIPTNTDREFLRAKKSFMKKKVEKGDFNSNKLLFTEREQLEFLINIIDNNDTLQKILNLINSENEKLYIGGGVIRNLVWDKMHDYKELSPINDIDIIYFNNELVEKKYDKTIEERLRAGIPNIEWSVTNQARMSERNNDQPYISLNDALEKWPETASAILVRKNSEGEYEFIAPFGYDDLFRLIVQPTPHFVKKLDKYRARINDKQWEKKWNRLKVLYVENPSR